MILLMLLDAISMSDAMYLFCNVSLLGLDGGNSESEASFQAQRSLPHFNHAIARRCKDETLGSKCHVDVGDDVVVTGRRRI